MASIIIPAKNEKENIGLVLSNIPKKHQIIVVDDGSTDNTSDVVRAFGYEPIRIEKNLGKGNACRVGVEHAKNENIVFMDGDFQHDPKDIAKILKELRKNDLVIGYRDFNKIPWYRNMSNRFATKLVNYITKKNFRDVQCGFRGIKKSKFQKLNLKGNGYEFENEMIINAVKNRLKIKEIPIKTKYHNISYTGKMRVGSRMPMLKSFKLFLYLIGCAFKRR